MLKFSVGIPPGSPLRILCLGAHCDDVEIGAGAAVMHLLESHPGSSVCDGCALCSGGIGIGGMGFIAGAVVLIGAAAAGWRTAGGARGGGGARNGGSGAGCTMRAAAARAPLAATAIAGTGAGCWGGDTDRPPSGASGR